MLLILITTLASLAVDPDETLRIVRRLSFRSALTASLATRMIPVLAADAQRLAEAQRTRPDGRATRGARARSRCCARSSAARSTARWTSPPRSRSAASRPRAARRACARPWSRHDLAFLASALAVAGLAVARAGSAGAARFDAYPEVHAARRRRHDRGLCRAARSRRCCRSPIAGGSSHERRRCCRFEQRQLPLPGRRRAGAQRRQRSRSGPGEFCLLAGLSGHGKSTLLRAACGLVPHFHGGHFAGRVDARRPRHARARARAISARSRACCSRTPRRSS